MNEDRHETSHDHPETSSNSLVINEMLPVFSVYVLYLIAVMGGLTGIVGVIIAYVYSGTATGWLSEHYRYQIRTFWIGLLYGAIVVLTMTILVGWLLWLLWFIWMIVRVVKGLKALQEKRAPDNIESWF